MVWVVCRSQERFAARSAENSGVNDPSLHQLQLLQGFPANRVRVRVAIDICAD